MFLESLEQDRFRLSGTKAENIDKEKVIDNTEKTSSRQEEQMMMMVALPNIDKNDKEIKTVKNSKKTQKQEKDYKTNPIRDLRKSIHSGNKYPTINKESNQPYSEIYYKQKQKKKNIWQKPDRNTIQQGKDHLVQTMKLQTLHKDKADMNQTRMGKPQDMKSHSF